MLEERRKRREAIKAKYEKLEREKKKEATTRVVSTVTSAATTASSAAPTSSQENEKDEKEISKTAESTSAAGKPKMFDMFSDNVEKLELNVGLVVLAYKVRVYLPSCVDNAKERSRRCYIARQLGR